MKSRQPGLVPVALLTLALAIGALTAAHPAHAQAQPPTLTGVLTVVWGDPGPGDPTAPSTRYFLHTAAGNDYELRLDPGLVDSLGGPTTLVGRTVTVADIGAAATANAGQAVVDVQSLSVDPGASAAAPDVTGNQPWLSILCKFADSETEQHPQSYYQSQLGDSYPGLNHYWRQVSYGQLDVMGSDAVGWYRLPRPRAYYVYDTNGDGSAEADLNRLTKDCTGAADPDVFLPRFVGINLMFNGGLGCCSYGGGAYIALDGETRLYRVTWMADWGQSNQAVMAHEMGHGFGMPHSSGMYGAVYDNVWDVMSNCYISPDTPPWGDIAQHPIAQQKSTVGWLPANRTLTVDALSQTFTLARLSVPPASGYLMARVPFGDSETDYYTLEARFRVGYDQYLPGDAVIIHQKTRGRGEPLVVDADNNGDNGDAGAMWTAGETFTDSSRGITIKVNAAGTGSFAVTVKTKNGPRLVRPANEAALEPGPVTIEWRAMAGATGYQLQIDRSPSFNSGAKEDLNLTAASYTATYDSQGRRYWRVRALPDGQFGATHSFVVADSLLPATSGPNDYSPTLVRGSDGKLQLYFDHIGSSLSAAETGVYRQVSADGGRTWSNSEQVTRFPTNGTAIATGTNGREWMVFAAYNGQMWQADSYDSGRSWSTRPMPTGLGSMYGPDLLRASDGSLYAAAVGSSGSGSRVYVWRSTDQGQTWSAAKELSDGGGDDYDPALAQLADGKVLIVWRRLNSLVKRTSTDGVNWSPIASVASDCCWSHPSLAVDAGGSVYLLARGSDSLRYLQSVNGGVTWSPGYAFTHYSGVENEPDLAVLPMVGIAAAFRSQRGELPVDRIWFGALGMREDTNAPPFVDAGGYAVRPRWPTTSDSLTFATKARDDAPGLQVAMLWSLNGVEQPNLALHDDGQNGDETANDGVWAGQLPPAPAGALSYRFRAVDTRGNVAYSAASPATVYVTPPFVKEQPVLLVVDTTSDTAAAWAQRYYGRALDGRYYGYDLWDAWRRGPVPVEVLNQYRPAAPGGGAVIWAAPNQPEALASTAGQAALAEYLDGGGRLVATGQDIAQQLQGQPFLSDYLHASFSAATSGTRAVEGVAGDVLGDGLSGELTDGESAENQSSPDVVATREPAVLTFNYTYGGGGAGLRVDAGAYRLAYFAFGLEGIADLDTRSTVLERSLTWLGLAPPRRARLIAPADAAVLPPGGATFTWLPVSGATGYRFQVAATADFAALVVDAQTAAASYTVASIPPGDYFWRVVTAPGGLASYVRRVSWRQPAISLASDSGSDRPALAYPGNGRLVLVYQQGADLRARTSLDRGATWAGPRVIIPGASEGIAANRPALAVVPGGRLWLTWARSGRLLLAYSDDGGDTWSAPQSGPSGQTAAEQPALAASAAGRLVLLWRVYNERAVEYNLYLATSADQGRTWSEPVQFGWPSWCDDGYALTQAADGRLLVAWSDAEAVYTASSADGGETWSSSRTVAQGTCQMAPGVAGAADGQVWLAYRKDRDILLRNSPDGGATWGPAEPLTHFAGDDTSPALAALESGRPALAWVSPRSDGQANGIWFLRPGFWEDTDPPPTAFVYRFDPWWPTASDVISVMAEAADESAGLRVDLVWSVNGGPSITTPMIDDGSFWTASIGRLPANTVLAYHVVAMDARGNTMRSPSPDSSVTILPVFQPAHPLLLVQDAGWQASYLEPDPYAAALTGLGYAYDVWPVKQRGPVPSAVLTQYTGGAVVWAAPYRGAMFLGGQEQAVRAFLDAGGRLFLSGAYVTAALAGQPLLSDYLYTDRGPGDSGSSASGVAGDPIGDALAFGLTDERSALWPLGPAQPILHYAGLPNEEPHVAALRVDAGAYRAVLAGFGLQSMDSSAEAARFLDRTLAWLGVTPPQRVVAWLRPAADHATTGAPFAIDIVFDAGVQRLTEGKTVIRFDPTALDVVTATGAGATAITGDPATFDAAYENRVDNAAGVIEYAATATGRAPEGTVHVARFWVSAAATGTTTLTFASETAAAYQGQPVLQKALDLSLEARQPAIYLPVMMR